MNFESDFRNTVAKHSDVNIPILFWGHMQRGRRTRDPWIVFMINNL